MLQRGNLQAPEAAIRAAMRQPRSMSHTCRPLQHLQARPHTLFLLRFPCATAPQAEHPRKKGRPGYGRPKSREETPKEGKRRGERGSAMSHCKNIVGRDQKGKCKKCRAAITAAGIRRPTCGAGPMCPSHQKEAVRASERPKSREETPVMGCGGEALILETADLVCPCSRRAATYCVIFARVYGEYDAHSQHNARAFPNLL